MTDETLDMKGDWDRRARENARYYIATSVPDDEAEFDASGARDVRYFFDGIEHLLHASAVVLDIGCGIGRMDRHVAPRVKRLAGIDVSGEMVARARERLADLPNVEYHEGDGWSLAPLRSGSFDLVFSHIVFQHLPRDVTRSYFREVHRVLKPGGSFVFQLPEQMPNTPADPPETDTFEMRFWTEDDLRSALAEFGFEWCECRRFAAGEESFRFNQLRVHVRVP